MSSGPPSSADVTHAEGSTSSDEPTGDGKHVGWRSITRVLAVMAIAGGVGLFLFRDQGAKQQNGHAPPARGLACPHLLAASDAYARGDRAVFRQEIAQAAKIADGALQKSGEVFGEPERIALELHLAPNQSSTRVKALLELASRSC